MMKFVSNEIFENLSKAASNNYLDFVLIVLFCLGYFLFKVSMLAMKKKDDKGKSINSIIDFNRNLREYLFMKGKASPKQILDEIKVKGFTPDTTTFNTMIDYYISMGNTEMAELTLSLMSENECSQDIVTFNTLIKGKSREIDQSRNKWTSLNQAMAILENIQINGVKTNIITWNTLIDCSLKARDLQKTAELVSSIVKNQESADDITFGTLLKGMRFQRSHKNKLEILNMIRTLAGDQMNILGKRAVLSGLFSCKLLKEAVHLYRSIEDSEMDQLTLRVLLRGFGEFRMYAYVNELQEKFVIDSYTKSYLLNSLVKCGKVKEAKEQLNEGENFNTVNCTIVLKGLAEAGLYNEAIDLFEEMKKNDESQPNLITYNTILNFSVARGNMERVKEILDSMKAKRDIGVDLITASTYIKGLFKNKMIKEATDYFDQIINENEVQVDEVLFNIMMNGYVFGNQPEKAVEMYKKMIESGKEGSRVSYSILVRAYTSLNRFDDTLDLLKEMKKKGEDIGKIVYTCILTACKKFDRIDVVEQLYEEMKDENSIDEVAISYLASTFLGANNPLKASDVLFDSFLRDIIPRTQIIALVLKRLTKEAARLLDESNQVEFAKYEKSILSLCVQLHKRNIELDTKLIKEIVKVICRKRCIEIGINLGESVNESKNRK